MLGASHARTQSVVRGFATHSFPRSPVPGQNRQADRLRLTAQSKVCLPFSGKIRPAAFSETRPADCEQHSSSDSRRLADQAFGGLKARLRFWLSQNRGAILMARKSLPLPMGTGEHRDEGRDAVPTGVSVLGRGSRLASPSTTSPPKSVLSREAWLRSSISKCLASTKLASFTFRRVDLRFRFPRRKARRLD